MVIQQSTPTQQTPMIVGLFVACWLLTLTLPLRAADPPMPDTTLVVDPATAPETTPEPLVKPDEQERRVKLTAGLAALAGIAILGIVLAAVIIIWAGRLRRLVREPTTPTGKQDPFWFLRPGKLPPLTSTENPPEDDER